MENKEETISESFFRILKEIETLSEGDSKEKEYEKKVRNQIKECILLSDLVQKNGVISKNEKLREIGDYSIKFLSLPYHIGRLFTMLPVEALKEPKKKLDFLKEAANQYTFFMKNMKDLGIIDKKEYEIFKNPKLLDNRQTKITMFRKLSKERKEVEKLKEGRAIMLEKRKKKKIENLEEQDDDEFREIERKYFLGLLYSYALELIDGMKYTEMEIKVLEFRASKTDTEIENMRKEKEREQQEYERKKLRDKMNGKKSPGLKFMKIDKNFAAGLNNLNDLEFRKKVQKEMFMKRNQPTISLEEHARMEMQKLKERTEKEKEMKKNEVEFDEDNVEHVNQKMYKDREWDNWSDWNPKGSGNMNK